MNTPDLLARNGATLKLLFIAALSLVMLIPLFMVRSIIEERQGLQQSAEQTIANRWGGSQTISGPVVVTHTPVKETSANGMKIRSEWRANALSELTIAASLITEWRYLGIYEVPVYTTVVNIKGRIDWERLAGLQAEGELIFWLPLGDVRGVRETSPLTLGSLELPATPLSIEADNNSGLQFTLSAADRILAIESAADQYRLEFRLAGSNSLSFLPLADTTRATLEADWPHPEFIGQFLPGDRSVSAEGTTANWQLLGLNRPFGDQWSMADMGTHQLSTAAFGLRLETPVDGYQRSERSVKYGFLFISLTFFTLFLFEVMTGRPLHPVPYVLTGAALAVFYLVLLALSEYLPFIGAFTIASGLLILIVTAYTGAVLGRRRRGYLVGAMMGLTYSLLYVLVTAEHASLLIGSLALLMAITALMYLTRKVDWYAYGRGKL